MINKIITKILIVYLLINAFFIFNPSLVKADDMVADNVDEQVETFDYEQLKEEIKKNNDKIKEDNKNIQLQLDDYNSITEPEKIEYNFEGCLYLSCFSIIFVFFMLMINKKKEKIKHLGWIYTLIIFLGIIIGYFAYGSIFGYSLFIAYFAFQLTVIFWIILINRR